MKSARIKKYGSADVVEILETEKPKVGRDQVLIKVYASSINPVDIKFREGQMSQALPDMKFPVTLGSDVAGVIAEIGEGVAHLSVGNKVYGQAIVLVGASGAFAEFAVTPASFVAKMPNTVDFTEAAAVVLTGVSAVQALIDHLDLKPNQKILIHGGSGGIGTIAIQIAKSIGAYVATTATGDGIAYVKKLGADEVIDYKNETFDEIIFDYDAVFDTVGGETYEKSFKVLKKGGMIVSMLMSADKKLEKQYGVTAISQFTQVNTERLNRLTKFIESNQVKVHIDKVYTIDKIKEAFEAKEKGDVKGKIAIEVHPVK